MGVTVHTERSSCPCLCSGVDEKSVSRPVGSWNFQGAIFPGKEKYRPRSAAMILSGESAAKWIGCVAGRWIFQGYSTARQCSKWTRPHLVERFKPIHKSSGIYKKNTTVCENRQEGFEKFVEVKREKYDTSCGFRKKYAMWIRTNPIFCLR